MEKKVSKSIDDRKQRVLKGCTHRMCRIRIYMYYPQWYKTVYRGSTEG